MTMSDLDRLLNATLLGTTDRISVTVTEIPDDPTNLIDLLEKAFEVGARKCTPLAAIQLPLNRFPLIPATFLHVPVTDSGNSGVLRLIYGEDVAAVAA
ncbi:MAG: hypothetical protein JWL62_1752 [Hyphomicrobiales bacterium]|nr:hypothetical protein [Hyphomicrobiales bacterium]